MKKHCLALLTIVLFCRGNLLAGESPSDNHFFVVMNAAMEVPDLPSWMALSTDKKKTNAEALYLLDVKASGATGLSNVVRLVVLASATQAFERYMAAIPHHPADLENFVNSSDPSAALFLLHDALNTLARTPTPHASLNVWSPGIAAAGMDPQHVSDPKVRAEYEQRIAENNQAIEEGNARIRIQNAIVSLKARIKDILHDLPSGAAAESLKAQIRNSTLPDEIKAEILGK